MNGQRLFEGERVSPLQLANSLTLKTVRMSTLRQILIECFVIILIQQYEQNDEVVLWMNTVGPYHNRQETYGYFSLPFCKGGKEVINHYHETLGEALQGVELDFSGLEIEFKGAIFKIYFGPLQVLVFFSLYDKLKDYRAAEKYFS